MQSHYPYVCAAAAASYSGALPPNQHHHDHHHYSQSPYRSFMQQARPGAGCKPLYAPFVSMSSGSAAAVFNAVMFCLLQEAGESAAAAAAAGQGWQAAAAGKWQRPRLQQAGDGNRWVGRQSMVVFFGGGGVSCGGDVVPGFEREGGVCYRQLLRSPSPLCWALSLVVGRGVGRDCCRGGCGPLPVPHCV
jgi:hypothetical protein